MMDDEDIILLAGIGAFLTAYGAARGAAEVIDTVYDTATDVIDDIPKNPLLRALGYGRKGGIL